MRVRSTNEKDTDCERDGASIDAFVGIGADFEEISRLIDRISTSSATVLLTGETGTGKEVVARRIHGTGPSRSGPFVPINCSALPSGLVESELFGHVRGAFTGAHATKAGLLASAGDGTVLLDEIGDMDSSVQSKLLRVVQEREIRPVGGTKPIPFRARVIAATNRDLPALVRQKRFRADLFFRLNVIPIHLSALRDRPMDIPPLAEHFVRIHAHGRPVRISPEAMSRLMALPWFGNARELENVIERALALCSEEGIELEDILVPGQFTREQGGAARVPRSVIRSYLTLDQMKARYIAETLRENDGNRTRTAKILGVDRKMVSRRARA